MEVLKVFIRHVMLWNFKYNKNTSKTPKTFSSFYDQGVIANHQVQNWFSKFRFGDTLLRDKLRPERSSNLNQFNKIGGM